MSEDYYSVPFLINSINGYMAKGAHYLLNIGPDEIGRLPEKSLQILSAVGNWYLAVREALEHSEPASELTTNASVLLTRRGCNLYVHIPSTARAEAVVLLNDRRSLSTSTELLPVYWASGERYLVVRDIPASELTDRTLVIKLEFAGPWAAALSAGAAEEVAGYVFRALRQLGSVSGEICGRVVSHPSGAENAVWQSHCILAGLRALRRLLRSDGEGVLGVAGSLTVSVFGERIHHLWVTDQKVVLVDQVEEVVRSALREFSGS